MFVGSSQLSTTDGRAVIKSRNFGALTMTNETVLGSSQKLGGAAKHLTDGNEKRICRLSFKV